MTVNNCTNHRKGHVIVIGNGEDGLPHLAYVRVEGRGHILYNWTPIIRYEGPGTVRGQVGYMGG